MNKQNQHKSKNQKTNRYVMGALPTPERHRQQGGLRYGFIKAERLPGTLVPRYRARYASPLDLYLDRQVIDAAQYHAGLQFGRAFHRTASGTPACHDRARLFGTLEEPPDTYGESPLAAALAYVEQAYASLTADTVNIVIDVCAYERPVEHAAALGGLRKGLGRLAEAWGMASTELCSHKED